MKKLIIKLLTKGMNYKEKRDLVKLIIGENVYEKASWQINDCHTLVKMTSNYINGGIVIPNGTFQQLCDKGFFGSMEQAIMMSEAEWYRNALRRSSKNLERWYFQS